MYTVFQAFTLLQAWLGEALACFLALFARPGVKVDDAESVSTVVGSDVDTDIKSADSHDTVTPAAADVDSPTEPEKDGPTGPELISAAVAASLSALPSLPSILKTPEARPPPPTCPNAVSEKQDFGTPSNLFYEHRLPLGDATNRPRFEGQQKGMRIDNFEVKPLPPRKIRVKSKSRAKKSRAVETPLIVIVDTDVEQSSGNVAVLERVPAPVSESVSAPVIVKSSVAAPESVPAPVLKYAASPIPAPVLVREANNAAPGSVEWENRKAAILAQTRTWNDRVKASRRISLPGPAPIPVPAPVDTLVPQRPKRHSAPPVLGAPRKSLQDRLSALLSATTDTIAALETEKADKNSAGRTKINDVPEIRDAIKEARRVSAAALEEGREVFTVASDSDDDDDERDDDDDIPLGQLFTVCKTRQDPPATVLPTVPPTSTPRVISSISASRSMADLANASSRSINELCDSYDQAMCSPIWRRLLARSDDIETAGVATIRSFEGPVLFLFCLSCLLGSGLGPLTLFLLRILLFSGFIVVFLLSLGSSFPSFPPLSPTPTPWSR
ncbi:hypothetical protein C8R47DRAFT_1066061 [Mycena vitilis]|nr:hypothetical protein C8R47DRAFT_1066061 [Mycena vitilis]